MEQIKLITDCTIEGLEKKINKFMGTLDEHTDIVYVYIDSYIDSDIMAAIYTDETFKIYKDHLLATIRYATYKIDEEPKEISETDNNDQSIRSFPIKINGYPVSP